MKEQSQNQEVVVQSEASSAGGSSPENGGTSKKLKDYLMYVHIAIGIFLMFGFAHVFNPVLEITPLGMQIMGVFLGAVYLWTFVSIIWPSVLGIIALAFTDAFPNAQAALSSAFGDIQPIVIFFTLLLFGALEHLGVSRYIARWFLTRKIINGRPYVFCFVLFFCTYVVSMVTTPAAGVLLMWAVLYATLREVGVARIDKFSSFMVFGIFWAGITGQATVPFTTSSLALVGVYNRITGEVMPYVPYLIFGLIMGMIVLTTLTLMMKYFFRPDVSKLTAVDIEMFDRDPLPPMDLRQKICFYTLPSFLLTVMVPTLFDTGVWIVLDWLKLLDVWGVAALHVVFLLLVHIDGKPVLDLPEVMHKYFAWPVYFCVALALALSAQITRPEMGILDSTIVVFQPLLGTDSPFAFMSIILTITVTITQLTNNVIIGAMVMPLIYGFGTPLGLDLAAAVCIMIFVVHIATLLPGSTAFTPLLWSNRDWISPAQIWAYSIPMIIVSLILYIVIGIPLVNFVFSLF